MLIKKVEFDFEIKDDKYHKYIFNKISRIASVFFFVPSGKTQSIRILHAHKPLKPSKIDV